MVVGWGLFWKFANKPRQPVEAPVTAGEKPEPIVADRSVEFETVTDRSPVEFRDNAAYSLLLARARGKTPSELAALSRRDIALAQLWQNPEMYRGVPVHLQGSALRVLRYPSKLSQTGWIYEASIITPEASRIPYVCVFEEAPKGFPIGTDVSERVVFNGYFLKIWKYQAGDVVRGAPLLVGKIGWQPREPDSSGDPNSILRWSLLFLGLLFAISLARWTYQLRRLFVAASSTTSRATTGPAEEIDSAALAAWAHSMADPGESPDEDDDAS
jgi:hypothetical protein